MTSFKLIVQNVRRHLRDCLIYFLTLLLAVSLFYAFNSISDQPAFAGMSLTRTLLYEQLGAMLALLSAAIAFVLAFLIVYANQFLLKRRKQELGIYMLLGMKKGRIARIFAGEALCIGGLALAAGLLFGFALSQGLSLVALKLFAIDIFAFRAVFSVAALKRTALCFAAIFLTVTACNVRTVSRVELIDLLTAKRKNETVRALSRIWSALLFLLALGCIATAGVLFCRDGILPSRENRSFQIAGIALFAGTPLLFASLSTVGVRAVKARETLYWKGLNAFLVQQIGSRLRTHYWILAIICGLLTVTICAVSVGVSTALAMNGLANASAPYDLNVLSDVSIDGDGDLAGQLAAQGVELRGYAAQLEQIAVYEAGFTYGEWFAGQTVDWWPIDRDVPDSQVSAIALSDLNRALAMQGEGPVRLPDGQYLLNCNYKGTYRFVEAALEAHPVLTVAGTRLERASEAVLQETYIMTSVGNNDRGTLILPDALAARLEKEVNVLLAQYRPGTDPDEVVQQLLPIGLDETHGYRYAEKNMMYDMFYGVNALVSFLCCYVGSVFLLICAALLALKQLTDTADHMQRYGLLQKLGATRRQIDRALFWQTAIFFAAPLAVAGIFSAVLIQKAMEVVENFMNLHISTNLAFTVVLFLAVYGGYFLATCLSCKRMVMERQNGRV